MFHGKPVDYHEWTNSLRLDFRNFEEIVMKDDDFFWVIAFINPRCRGCTAFAPHFTHLQGMDGITSRPIKFGYVDITLEYNVTGIAHKFTGGRP